MCFDTRGGGAVTKRLVIGAGEGGLELILSQEWEYKHSGVVGRSTLFHVYSATRTQKWPSLDRFPNHVSVLRSYGRARIGFEDRIDVSE